MLWILIPIIVAAIDQLTKYIVVRNIGLSERIPVIDGFFYLTLHKNQGGAWGILQNSRVLFLILIPVVSAFLVYYIIRNKDKFLRFTLALILGGAIGNYIDRIVEGSVTDFLLFYIGSYPFPVFNAADIAVTCGTILLAVYILFIYKEPKKAVQEEKNEE
jgi:signal peptidase II